MILGKEGSPGRDSPPSFLLHDVTAAEDLYYPLRYICQLDGGQMLVDPRRYGAVGEAGEVAGDESAAAGKARWADNGRSRADQLSPRVVAGVDRRNRVASWPEPGASRVEGGVFRAARPVDRSDPPVFRPRIAVFPGASLRYRSGRLASRPAQGADRRIRRGRARPGPGRARTSRRAGGRRRRSRVSTSLRRWRRSCPPRWR